MTFPAELERLLKEATEGKWQYYWRVTDGKPDCGVFSEKYPGQAYSVCRSPQYQKKAQWKSDAALICLLRNHAEAIRDLVVAAEKVSKILDHPTQSVTVLDASKLREALAKLEEA